MPKNLFISHISEEAEAAARVKTALERDFLGLVEIFVSSDTESIAAGEQWLTSIEAALREASMLVILCSPKSVARPWINFEAGAAWVRQIPLIPVCHAGLAPRDLPMPLSLRQGVALADPDGLRRLYTRVAQALACRIPVCRFEELARELSGAGRHDNRHGPLPTTPPRSVHASRRSWSTQGSSGAHLPSWRQQPQLQRRSRRAYCAQTRKSASAVTAKVKSS
jgi:TIR domain